MGWIHGNNGGWNAEDILSKKIEREPRERWDEYITHLTTHMARFPHLKEKIEMRIAEVEAAKNPVKKEETDWDFYLRREVKEAKEGTWSKEPLEAPTEGELTEALEWFSKRELLPELQTLLEERGWRNLADPWEVRAALELARAQLARR